MNTPVIALSRHETLAFRIDGVARQLSRAVDARLLDYGLSRAQWRLLAYVLRDEGLTQSELARIADVERATIGQTIDVMERKQLLERRHSASDRRTWRIFPTEKARALVPEMRVPMDGVFAQMLAGFDAEETRLLASLLDRVAENLEAVAACD